VRCVFSRCVRVEAGVVHGSVGGHGISGSNHLVRSVHMSKIRPQSISFLGTVLIPMEFSQENRIFMTRYTKETLQRTKAYQVYS
jgi:hypothetical protein